MLVPDHLVGLAREIEMAIEAASLVTDSGDTWNMDKRWIWKPLKAHEQKLWSDDTIERCGQF